jgi:hypothetical protein
MFMRYSGGGIGHLQQKIPQIDVLDAGTADSDELEPMDIESYNALAELEDVQQVSGPITDAEGREEVDDDPDENDDSDEDSDSDDNFNHSDDMEDSELDSNLGPEDGENSYNTSDDDNL